ncbi:hypothetical protein NOR_06714 [Metarhizium rileyi]|uniref:Uncharacterized protein n=1 Tax=Metarhizium rileyi (strain RCEF 4871) TaxID=1649241 RepID=A0A166ZWW5_METRR|nr:hypothetical protein NOR_06714 [Metarhizium rileyi RCEF 4871]
MVFATAALVQFETGRRTSRIETFFRDAGVVEAMQSLPAGVTFRGLAWLVATAGAVAATNQQDFFERMMKDVLDTSVLDFANCGTMLEVLQ